MPPTIRIKVVAAVDGSLKNVFVPLETAATRARTRVNQESAGAAAGFSGVGAAAKRAAADTELGAAAMTSGFAALSQRVRTSTVDLKTLGSVAETELKKIQREQAKAALGIGGPASSYTGTGFSVHGVGRVAGRIASGALHFGTRLGADMLQGLGVNTDLASMFTQNRELETTATDVSNFGYIPGSKGPNGARVNPDELVAEAHKVAQSTGNQASDVLGGLEKFVGLTGDLATGREAMQDLAVLSKATGSNLSEMVEAAGNVSNVLGDVPNKGKAVYDVMKLVAGEGKTGAVLIKDLATQMAKVAAGAQMFAGNRSENIAVLGALAQEARGRGGSASASQAATSVASFVNTFSKGARLQNFKGFGVNVQGDGGLRDARDIIVDSLNAAMRGGNRVTPEGRLRPLAGGEGNFSQNLGFMFADVRARSAVRGFESIYRETYSSTHGNQQEKMEAATRAVRAEFERLTSAAMSEALVQEDFRIAMQTSKSQIDVFNDKMTETAGALRAELLPAVLELAPAVLALTKEMASGLSAIFGRAQAPEVKKNLETFNSLEPFWKAVHGDNPGKPMVFNPNAGDLSWKPSQRFNAVSGEMEDIALSKGSTGKTGMWEPEVRSVPEDGVEFVNMKKDEAQQELQRQQDKLAKARAAFVKYEAPEGYAADVGEANATASDPAKLREMANSTFSPIEGGKAQDILAALDAVNRAQSDVEHAQIIADKLAAGIADKTIKVIVMNAADMRAEGGSVQHDPSARLPPNSSDAENSSHP